MSMEKEDEALSCCEYINSKGRKVHLFQVFCDCNELDEYSEGLVTHSTDAEAKSNSFRQVLSVIEDRICRFPFPRGARKITKEFLFPALAIPILQFGLLSLCQSILLSFFLFWGALIGLLIAWYMWYRRSKIFFFTILIFECMQLWVYEYYLVGIISYPKVITFTENLFLLLLFFSCIGLVLKIRSHRHHTLGQVRGSKYCKICAANVVGRDHHCIWLDACIFEGNTFSFYGLLVLCVIYLVDYALIGLSSICHSFSGSTELIVVPSNDCRLDDFPNQMICLSSLNACVISIPLVGLCVFRCIKNVFI